MLAVPFYHFWGFPQAFPFQQGVALSSALTLVLVGLGAQGDSCPHGSQLIIAEPLMVGAALASGGGAEPPPNSPVLGHPEPSSVQHVGALCLEGAGGQGTAGGEVAPQTWAGCALQSGGPLLPASAHAPASGVVPSGPSAWASRQVPWVCRPASPYSLKPRGCTLPDLRQGPSLDSIVPPPAR